MCYERTDMAIEAAALFNKTEKDIANIKGVTVEKEQKGKICITKVTVSDENGEKALGKPKGRYVTIDMPDMMNGDDFVKNQITDIIASELKGVFDKKKENCVFVVGLGNDKITPDALGPKVAEGICVTRHLFDESPEYISDNTVSVCAMSPGVLGITGIETLEVIKGIAERIKPSAVICIDALATRSIERLLCSVQIADTGITPGAGVGNRRHRIDKEALGIPVIAIGVPTVVDGATIANDSINLLKKSLEIYSPEVGTGFIERLDDEKRYSLVKELLKPYGSGLIVTPKDIDLMTEEISVIISSAINRAFGNE